MKTNAKARIILWSVVALVLTGVLVWFLLPHGGYRGSDKKNGFGGGTQSGSDENAPAAAAATVTWDGSQPATDGSTHKADGVTGLKIDWICGSVQIEAVDGDEVEFWDDYSSTGSGEYAMDWGFDGSTLEISYCKDVPFAVTLPEKTLSVRVPEQLLQTIEIETVSASVSVGVMTLDSLKIDSISGSQSLNTVHADSIELSTTSGSISGDALSARELDAESISGSIEFSGTFTDAEFDTTSGSVRASFGQAPEKLDADSISGSFTFILPSDSFFRCKLDTVSGDLDSELAIQGSAGSAPEYHFSTTSGDVYLKAAK